MFTLKEKKDLDILSVDIKMISNEETETGGVQVGAGTNDTVGGETGEFPSDVGENIHGVGNDEEDTIRGITNQRGNDLLKQGYVPLQQVQPGLALDLSCTRGDDAEVRPHRDGVVGGGVDLGSGEECCGVLKVQHLSSELVGNGVDEDELVGEVLGEYGLGYGHSHVACTDNGDLAVSLRGRRWGSVHYGLEEGLG